MGEQTAMPPFFDNLTGNEANAGDVQIAMLSNEIKLARLKSISKSHS
ncbi:hypothetical protein JCM14722_30130 [Pseudodesulfovibrio portus]|uniref:Uncharacterized protein n=1 Tax=Pseudodesulfovibrio portus TaxID=231439 RepID=A0ABN6RWW5_9BACT|nr:hypothetical protein JCM14722_30130 [Pseudodesulfovibrio portus]